MTTKLMIGEGRESKKSCSSVACRNTPLDISNGGKLSNSVLLPGRFVVASSSAENFDETKLVTTMDTGYGQP